MTDPLISFNFQSFTPLHAAAAMGQESVLAQLLRFGASVCCLLCYWYLFNGEPVLDYCICAGEFSLVLLLQIAEMWHIVYRWKGLATPRKQALIWSFVIFAFFQCWLPSPARVSSEQPINLKYKPLFFRYLFEHIKSNSSRVSWCPYWLKVAAVFFLFMLVLLLLLLLTLLLLLSVKMLSLHGRHIRSTFTVLCLYFCCYFAFREMECLAFWQPFRCYCLIDLIDLIDWLIDWLNDWFFCLFIDWMMGWFTDVISFRCRRKHQLGTRLYISLA